MEQGKKRYSKDLKWVLIAAFVVIVGVAAFGFFGGAPTPAAVEAVDTTGLTGPVILEVDEKTTLCVDPKIEAAYLIFALIEDKTNFRQHIFNANYIRGMKSYYTGKLDHPVFDLAIKMHQRGFSYDAIPQVMHYFDNEGNLIGGIELDPSYAERCGGAENMHAFAKAVADFRVKTGYDAHFLSYKDFFVRRLELGKKYITSGRKPMGQIFKDHYGSAPAEIWITVTPEGSHGYGCSVKTKEGIRVMPTLDVMGSEANFVGFLCHEISHAYVNPATEAYSKEIAKSKGIFKAHQELFKKQAYPEWGIVVNEYFVRANTYLLMDAYYGWSEKNTALEQQPYYEIICKNEADNGFIHIPQLIELLYEYRDNRGEFDNFAAYVPTLLQAMVSYAN